MALLPWTYNNPRVNRTALPCQTFTFHGQSVQVLQDTDADIDISKNTGLKLWDGAYLLARHLENLHVFPAGFWSGKKCIELGAGCGLVGTVAWLLGGHVTLTDLSDPLIHTERCRIANVPRLCLENTHLQAGNIRTVPYCWGSTLSEISPPYDIILGSDVIYQPQYASDLFKAFSDLGTPSAQILIAYKPRGLGEEVFFEILKENSYIVEEVNKENHPADFKDSDYRILWITKH